MQFRLEDIECWVHLGVPDWERENPQKIFVSLQFSCDTTKAEISDDVEDTVDYFEIYKLVKAICNSGEYKLLEKLYRDLRERITGKFPQVFDLEVTIEKRPFSDARVFVC